MPRELARYVRVSRQGDRDFDHTLTQPVQLRDMERFAATHADLHLSARVYDDLDRPAPDFDAAKRPSFADARGWVMARPLERGLIVANPSRFGRNDMAMFEISEWHSAGALVVFADSGLTSDLLDTADGYFMLLIIMGLASTDRRRIKINWEKSLAERAERGLHHGRVPAGYYRFVDPNKGTKGHKVDPRDGHLYPSEGAEAIRQIFVDYANGTSVRQLAIRLAEIKGTKPEPSTIKHMMKNEVFRGKIRRKSAFVEGAHEALVDAETWAKVQRRNRSSTRSSSQLDQPRSYLAGLMRCHECGGSVVIVNQKSRGTFVACRKNRTYPAGSVNRCVGFGTPLLSKVESFFKEAVALAPSEEHLHRAASVGTDRQHLIERLDALQDTQRTAEQGRDRLSVQFALQNISESTFTGGTAALEEEIAHRADQIRRLEEELALLPEVAVDRTDKSRTLLDAIESLPLDQARHAVAQEIESMGIGRLVIDGKRQHVFYPRWVAERSAFETD